MESILLSVKKLLGFEADYNAFDSDIILNINMVFNILNQLGIGPEEGFSISDESSTWDQFIGDTRKLEMVKTYVYMKVKQVFDPGNSSALNTAIDSRVNELEWRLKAQAEFNKEEQ